MTNSPFRRVSTDLPVPELLSVEDDLKTFEPRLREQVSAFWERAEGAQIYDNQGNMWLDWTSGVLTANAGHGPEPVKAALKKQVNTGVLHSYRFPITIKAEFFSRLAALTGYQHAVLSTTGSEAVEVALRIAWEVGKPAGRNVIVSFTNAHHGSGAVAQAVSGDFSWSPVDQRRFAQVPFPDVDHESNSQFDSFRKALALKDVATDSVAAVMIESYQGRTLSVGNATYMQELAAWCEANGVLLIADEIQSGFGRTGTLFAFEHFGLKPDLVCCGKGISGSLPLSAVLCKNADLLAADASSLSSTHSGNPLVLAGAVANFGLYEDGSLLNNAAQVGAALQDGLRVLADKHPEHVDGAYGIGMVGALSIVDADGSARLKAARIVDQAWRNGLLVFKPIEAPRVLIKAAPPLVSTFDQVADGLSALEEVLSAL